MKFDVWRALASVLTGAICRTFVVKEQVKSLRPETRSPLETGALLDDALSRYLRTDRGASL